jgi:hypothetical protein
VDNLYAHEVAESGTDGHDWETEEAEGYRIVPDRYAEQRHYTQQRLTRDPDYEGLAKTWDEDKATAVLVELLCYFSNPQGCLLPPPPYGLPGALKVAVDEDIMEILGLGASYLQAVAEGRPRRQINLYEKIKQFEYRAWRSGYDQCAQEILDRENARTEREIARGLADGPDVRSVYFIGSDEGMIKIGVAGDPKARLRDLQAGSPVKLRILATTTGGQAGEGAYHKRFADLRAHGEWFERHDDILAEIARLSPGDSDD